MKKMIGLMFLSFAILSCTTLSRVPSSTSGGITEAFVVSYQQLEKASLDRENCAEFLVGLNQQLSNVDFSQYSNQELKEQAKSGIDFFWQYRSKLHTMLPSIDKNCSVMMLNAFHQMRYIEDYLGEFAYGLKPLVTEKFDFQSQPIPIYDEKFYPGLQRTNYANEGQLQFQSGDLMIARGVSFVSAVISQVSENHSEYSHVVFVSEDPQQKKLKTIESYIGVGVAPYEMDFALKNENARLLVLRPKIASVGQKASELIYDKVTALQKKGQKIPYDYNMDFVNHNAMSCAEVATSAYEWASDKKIILPEYPSQIKLKNDKFLKMMGLKRGDIFTPDDLEIDPHFDMVAEWRDYRIIRDSRHKDAILSEMMRWIGDLNYNFHDSVKSLMAKYIILPSRPTRIWPLVKKLTGAPDLDSNMPKSTLGLMTVLSQVGTSLLDKVSSADSEYFAKFGRPMTNSQLRAVINSAREADLKSYKEVGRSEFHYLFRPSGVQSGPVQNPLQQH